MLTMKYVFGCLEGTTIDTLRQLLDYNEGVGREVYVYPFGMYLIATFQNPEGKTRFEKSVGDWMELTLEGYPLDEIVYEHSSVYQGFPA